jgi:hypothetical protein
MRASRLAPLALAAALTASCVVAGGHGIAGYTSSRTLYRAATEPFGALVVLPLVVHDREPVAKVDTRPDWPAFVRDTLVRYLVASGATATGSSAENVAGRSVAEVVEKNLVDRTGALETDLAARAPDALKVFNAWRTKTMELAPDRWAEKYAEFATRFADNPSAELARRRADWLATPAPVAELPILRAAAAAAGATHVVIPARLAWVTDLYVRGGVKHRALDATLELLVWSARSELVVWRGHGVFETNPDFDEPAPGKYLDESVDRAAKNAVGELLAK